MRSGVVNAGGPFDLRVTAGAEESAYAGIVRLVREAESSQAPFVRLARPLRPVVRGPDHGHRRGGLGGGRVWPCGSGAGGGHPVSAHFGRAVALVAGLSRGARRGIVRWGARSDPPTNSG